MFWRRAAGGLSLPTLDFGYSESDNMVKCYLGFGKWASKRGRHKFKKDPWDAKVLDCSIAFVLPCYPGSRFAQGEGGAAGSSAKEMW